MKNNLILRKAEGRYIIVKVQHTTGAVQVIGEIQPAGNFIPYPNIGEIGADQLQQLAIVSQNFELFYTNII